MALGGVSYAATSLPKNSVGSKQLKKGAVKRSDIAKGAVTGRKVAAGSLTGKQIDDGHARAGALGRARRKRGHRHRPPRTPAAQTLPAARTLRLARASPTCSAGRRRSTSSRRARSRTFNVKLAFGETKTLFSVGTLTFSAKCLENSPNPAGLAGQDVVELLVATSQNGAILADGANGGLFGANADDFLDTDTVEADRAVAWLNSAAGTALGSIENNGAGYGMHVVDPNGVVVSVVDPVTGAVNLFGSDCLLAGSAIIP